MSNAVINDFEEQKSVDQTLNYVPLDYELKGREYTQHKAPKPSLNPKPSLKPFFLKHEEDLAADSLYEGLLTDSQILEKYNSLMALDPDYFRVPADFEEARKKGLLHRISVFGKPYPQGKLPLLVPKENLKVHSMSYFLFFEFVEDAIVILFIVFFISCIFDLLAISLLASWNKIPAPEDPFRSLYYVTMLDKDPPQWVITVKLVLNLISIAVIKMFTLSKEVMHKTKYTNAYQTFSENDFSILVNLLPSTTTVEDVHEYFNNLSEKLGYGGVHHVIMLENVQEILRLKGLKKKIIQDFIKSGRLENKKRKNKIREIKKIDEKVLTIRLEQSQQTNIYKGAIVVFENPEVNRIIAKQWKRVGVFTRLWIRIVRIFNPQYKNMYNFKDHLITIKRCGEPADLIYKNLAIPTHSRNIRKLLAIGIITLLILLYPGFEIAYQIIFLIEVQDGKIIPKPTNPWTGTILFGGLSLLIYVSIKLMVVILSKTQRMRRKSDSDKFKITSTMILTFINYNLLIAAKIFTYPDDGAPYITNLVMLLVGMIFSPQLIELIDPEYWYKVYRRSRLAKKADNNLAQSEADSLYENPPFDYNARVNNISAVTFMCLSTYMFLPIAPLIGILAICSAYIVDRYLILRRCPNLTVRGYELGMYCFRTFHYDVMVQSFGNMILCLYFYFENQLNLANIILATLFIIFNATYLVCCNGMLAEKLTKSYVRRKSTVTQKEFKTYSSVKDTFKESYYKEYKNFLHKNDMLSLMQ